jgi:phospholysine phosphohistidine inorganic pyrophosphate phosphatase
MTPPRAFLLDLDGTLYVGDAAVPGAVETIARLRRRGTPFRCVTNTTSRSRAMLVERLAGYGFDVAASEIFSATLAGAQLARERGHRVLAPFTPPASHADLEGFELVIDCATYDGPVDAVLLGDLGEVWSYRLLQAAFDCAEAGAELIALSRDRYFRRGERLSLDAGPFVAALEYATGKSATLAGKPSAAFFGAALASFGLSDLRPSEVAMVGDDLWSDVGGAQEAGMQGWLVRTGKFSAEALERAGVVPDRVLASVADIVADLG